MLRAAEAPDRGALIELFAAPEVSFYLGGAHPRAELERTTPEVPGQRAGFFVVELGAELIGIVTIDRRGAERPGHLRPEAEEAELGYMFLNSSWGSGYATEAAAAALQWLDRASPGEPVVLCTQTANQASVRVAEKLGFCELERFEEFGAEQWFGVRQPTGATN